MDKETWRKSNRDLAIDQVPITTKPEVQFNYGTKQTLLRVSKRDSVINQVPITTKQALLNYRTLMKLLAVTKCKEESPYKQLPVTSWTQSATAIVFTLPSNTAGQYVIQLFNGSVLIMSAQEFTVSALAAVPTDAIAKAPRIKKIYMLCVDRWRMRHVLGANVTCPAGYLRS